jgi:hypothetical protein
MLTNLYSLFIVRHSSLLSLFLIICTTVVLAGCKVYSFSGGDTGCAQTITIRNFFNDAGGGPPNLGQTFTEKLRNYYQQNSKLTALKEGGDWIFDGRIVRYFVEPIAPTGSETAGLNRLHIEIQVTFVNNLQDEPVEKCPNEPKSFESVNFSFYDDFQQNQSLSQVETALIETITNRIVFDIFTRTTSNW